METMFNIERYHFNEYDNIAGEFFDKHVSKNSYYLKKTRYRKFFK